MLREKYIHALLLTIIFVLVDMDVLVETTYCRSSDKNSKKEGNEDVNLFLPQTSFLIQSGSSMRYQRKC